MKFRLDGATISESAKVNRCKLGKFTFLDERVRFTESELGDYSYLMHDAEAIYTKIGKFCAIAPFVRINPSNHPYWRPAMANFTYRSIDYGLGENDQSLFDLRKSQTVDIGHDVWIGQAALVMPGVKIGTGAVIGGNAVVTKDVPPYTIFGGVPARLIRDRFSKNVVDSLFRISWWNWSDEKIKDRLEDLRMESIKDFCRKYDVHFVE